jgi:hypothetical protein
MAVLSRELRKRLEIVVADARNVAENAAEKALKALAVGEREPHRSMTDEQKGLRNRLRAHGRQLGDLRSIEKGTQELGHLVTECGYQHWHRMLFARFLAENQLLLEPESGVAIAIDEVKDLARARAKDWVVLAGEFAMWMLPQVFRQDDPVLEVAFAPEDRKRLEALLASLPVDVFTASDSLGWTYQFWQAKRKEEINAEGRKIGADELPSVTQLFTEDYMVDFLLDNTLGAWHAGKVLAANPALVVNATSEEELRKAFALPGCQWKYLRLTRDKDGEWALAAGTFEGWPNTAGELMCLDPCMGSGHFVVATFERLVALRLAESSLSEAQVVSAVIGENVFGLELDPRCAQIAAFNLALAAWRRVGHCALPEMNLACSGLAPNATSLDWLTVAGDNDRLQAGMARLYALFSDAPVLGSLINPHVAEGDLVEAGFHEVQPLLEKALARETNDDTEREMAVVARGLAKAAEILAGQFTLVATNVPYLGRGKQDEVLQDYCQRVYPNAKSDLATCFVERCYEFCAPGGTTGLVTPQNWLFMGSYADLRRKLLDNSRWQFVARLGPKGFQTPMWDFNIVLICVTRQQPTQSSDFAGLDVGDKPTPREKLAALISTEVTRLQQYSQRKNPDCRILLTHYVGGTLLSAFVDPLIGFQNGDSPRFLIQFWEVADRGTTWEWLQSTTSTTTEFNGCDSLLRWEQGRGAVTEIGLVKGREAWGKRGVCIRLMSDLPCCLYLGHFYDQSSAAIIPKDPKHLAAIWAFCSSSAFHEAVREVDQALKVTNATLGKVPFDLAQWQKVAAERYPHGLPKPFSNDPTQWLFNGHPRGADQSLHVAVARLLGYRWPRQTGTSFPDCPALGPDGLETLADDDGIVPIASAKGEGPAAERVRDLLARGYDRDWSISRQEELLVQVGYAGVTIDDWLRDGFFGQHCTLFHNRPFIWQIWDGERDGFNALINYHKLAAPNGLGRKTLEKLTFAYLGDWIGRQRAEQKQGKEGADTKLAAALHLQEQLKEIIDGEPPYDLFVRWKPLHQQAIGWEPDLNDGVRTNIRPFVMAETLQGKSIFRKAPKIKWEKDRGKEPKRAKRDFPWFWSWDEERQDFAGGREFDGNRWNDLHYSNKTKREARARDEERQR